MLAGIAGGSKLQASSAQHSPTWSTRFLQHDGEVECADILFACFCLPCAAAKAKSVVDRSDCCFNLCCWTPAGVYHYTRLAYGIDGVCGDDLAWSCLCPCMEIRQALTEGKRRGAALSIPPQAGTNSIPWSVSLFDCTVCELCETSVCFPCVTHTIHQHLQPKADSCCFDFLCIAPTSMYGQVRHQYGILSDIPLCEDVLLPLACFPCSLIVRVRSSKGIPTWFMPRKPSQEEGMVAILDFDVANVSSSGSCPRSVFFFPNCSSSLSSEIAKMICCP